MSKPEKPSDFNRLMQKGALAPPPAQTNENELDTLLTNLSTPRSGPHQPGPGPKVDRVQQCRELVMNELIPAFVEMVEKYAAHGISMDMDASNLLQGGRELRFEFRIGEHRVQLAGTVTSDTIAFHETRYHPRMRGELVSGPMLSLNRLNAQKFREFVCERLTLLARGAKRNA